MLVRSSLGAAAAMVSFAFSFRARRALLKPFPDGKRAPPDRCNAAVKQFLRTAQRRRRAVHSLGHTFARELAQIRHKHSAIIALEPHRAGKARSGVNIDAAVATRMGKMGSTDMIRTLGAFLFLGSWGSRACCRFSRPRRRMCSAGRSSGSAVSWAVDWARRRRHCGRGYWCHDGRRDRRPGSALVHRLLLVAERLLLLLPERRLAAGAAWILRLLTCSRRPASARPSTF